MSALRAMKRKAAAPKVKQAKKIAAGYMENERIAHQATLAQKNKINRQAVARINTCVFMVLHKVFRMSGRRIAELSNEIDFQVDCIRDNQPGTKEPYLTYEAIIDELLAETKWKFPPYELLGKNRVDMTAAEMADYDAKKFLNEAKAKMELLWLWLLRIREGFSKIRLDRFSRVLRQTETELTTEAAEGVRNWLENNGIEFVGFDKKHFDSVEFYAG